MFTTLYWTWTSSAGLHGLMVLISALRSCNTSLFIGTLHALLLLYNPCSRGSGVPCWTGSQSLERPPRLSRPGTHRSHRWRTHVYPRSTADQTSPLEARQYPHDTFRGFLRRTRTPTVATRMAVTGGRGQMTCVGGRGISSWPGYSCVGSDVRSCTLVHIHTIFLHPSSS